MNIAISARVSTHDKDQNPETQLRPLRQHLAGSRMSRLWAISSTRLGPMTCGVGEPGMPGDGRVEELAKPTEVSQA